MLYTVMVKEEKNVARVIQSYVAAVWDSDDIVNAVQQTLRMYSK
jgi:hypothetical protein